jgi:hypothetical protein
MNTKIKNKQLDLVQLETFVNNVESDPVYTSEKSGLELIVNKGAINGYASLDASALVPLSQLPDSVKGSGFKPAEYTELYSDFVGNVINTNSPLLGNTIINGTVETLVANSYNWGVARINSTTSANAGYRFATDNFHQLIGGERFEAFVSFNDATNSTVRIGFHNGTTVTSPTAGFIMQRAAASWRGVVFTATGSTVAVPTYSSSAGQWLYVMGEANAALTDFRFMIKDYSTGSTVYDETITPATVNTGAVAVSVLATESSTTARTGILDIDYIRANNTKITGRVGLY